MTVIFFRFRQLLLGSLREKVPQGSTHATGESHQHPFDSSVGLEVLQDPVGQEARVLRPPIATVLSKGKLFFSFMEWNRYSRCCLSDLTLARQAFNFLTPHSQRKKTIWQEYQSRNKYLFSQHEEIVKSDRHLLKLFNPQNLKEMNKRCFLRILTFTSNSLFVYCEH